MQLKSQEEPYCLCSYLQPPSANAIQENDLMAQILIGIAQLRDTNAHESGRFSLF